MPGEIKKFVVTSVVMRHFFSLPGAPRACADFCDPTAVSRIIGKVAYETAVVREDLERTLADRGSKILRRSRSSSSSPVTGVSERSV